MAWGVGLRQRLDPALVGRDERVDAIGWMESMRMFVWRVYVERGCRCVCGESKVMEAGRKKGRLRHSPHPGGRAHLS